MAFRRQGFLQLQMGQEIVYLLLTGSFLVTTILAVIIFHRVKPPEMVVEKTSPSRASSQPPIIVLSEANDYRFGLGTWDVSPEFRNKLIREVIPKIRELGRHYSAHVVEVVGHTDAIPIADKLRLTSNMDKALMDFVHGRVGTMPPPFDNVGLGMARAVSVAKALREAGLGNDFAVLPMSAGPVISPGDQLAAWSEKPLADDKRRRIEIRLRRGSVALELGRTPPL